MSSSTTHELVGHVTAANARVIAACVKWADLRPEIDPLLGSVTTGAHGAGISESDRAAVEVALATASAWGDGGAAAASVVVVCLGPPQAEAALREFLACGADRVVRVDVAASIASNEVAALLAAVLAPADLEADLVVCGDVSADRGSGSVPAFLAHELGHAQALGLIAVDASVDGVLQAVRRLDGARRERLRVTTPAVISVEGSVADLRRASLAATLAAREAEIELRTPRVVVAADPIRLHPWRPRSRVLAPPEGADALDRIVQLTGAFVDRTPPRTLVLEPAAAAAAVLDQLRVWGYLDAETPPLDVVTDE